jgi:hypothetical protein
MKDSEKKQRRCRKFRGAWRAEVGGRIVELRGRLDAVRGYRAVAAPGQVAADPGWEKVAEAVERDLSRAETALLPPCALGKLGAWWSGSAITTAWESVHVAELALIGIERRRDVAVIVPRLLSWMERTMDQGPQRKAHEEALREPKPTRAEVRAALTDVIEANGNRYANLRAFRNNLILVMFALLVTVAGIAVWHAANPSFLSLCTTSTPPGGGNPVTECLGNGPKARGADVAMVAALGALGGLLAIAFAFSERDVAPTRYDPKTWQAFLKPVTGAATAIVAVLLLQSNLLLKPVEQNQSMFLAYAVIFGFSQQLLTRFVDKRAESLITPTEKPGSG